MTDETITEEGQLRPARGFVEERLAAELPGLRLRRWVSVAARPRSSPRDVVDRLHDLANRYRGANVVALRVQPIPHAYRAFYRQIGLDPDVTRIPSEQVAVDRLVDGGLRSRGLVRDALLIAVVETGLPMWALDADLVAPGGLGIRASVAGDRLGHAEHSLHVPEGRLVVADADSVHALLFSDVATDHAVSSATTRIVLFTVAVQGVPEIHVEEALWIAADVLGGG